eukprot:CAMPEP_0179169670 /NCGR_PEP_ID=MMETSP0796-20121207/83536_1 /TAXON_ID=73915 /ORGANISM="Pyrodinium bahamense, Strain pbaha01" /LENGTH=49 /DNA_ID= /DNA_START= /DNA_END= /DNA_ORIENTATION=
MKGKVAMRQAEAHQVNLQSMATGGMNELPFHLPFDPSAYDGQINASSAS